MRKNNAFRDDKIQAVVTTREEIQAIIDANKKTNEDVASELKPSEVKNPIDAALDDLADAIKNNDSKKAETALGSLNDELQKLEGEELKQTVENVAQKIEDAAAKAPEDSPLKKPFEL